MEQDEFAAGNEDYAVAEKILDVGALMAASASAVLAVKKLLDNEIDRRRHVLKRDAELLGVKRSRAKREG